MEDLEIKPEGEAPEAATEQEPVAMEDLLTPGDEAPAAAPMEDVQLMAVLEAVVYVAEEPLTMAQIAAAIQQPPERVEAVLRQLIAELEKPGHGIAIREVAGGFKMATKAEHHEAVRSFVKSLKPPMKLSLPALETLAVIAYKQPVTAPEIMEIRGVQGAGVLKTLLDRKLIAVAGRKNVIGKPILYKTTRDFLIQFGLNDVNELPSLKEFEEIRRMAFSDSEPAVEAAAEPSPAPELGPKPVPEPEVGQALPPADSEPQSEADPMAPDPVGQALPPADSEPQPEPDPVAPDPVGQALPPADSSQPVPAPEPIVPEAVHAVIPEPES